MKEAIKVTVNNEALARVLGVKAGAELNIECRRGVPLSREWRNRFKDAEVDGCITVHQHKVKPAKAAKSEGDK